MSFPRLEDVPTKSPLKLLAGYGLRRQGENRSTLGGFMAAMRCGVLVLLLLHSSLRMSAARSHSPSCGGTLRSSHGVLSTPNFPGPFPVPMKCRWVIDNSDNAHPEGDSSSILVFLTQLYVTSGLTFTEFVHWEEDSPQYQLGRRLVHEVTERNVTSTPHFY
uniref:(California timema) hypothetical protein n=1 Tax=Timema californicum TaxID=61474 RepID=A0A7R9P3Z6_TIMCA|nr:unnamed protein product [Timema californicum]